MDDVDSDEAAGLGRTAVISSSLSTETLNTAQSISQMYRKSLRLTSEQIVGDKFVQMCMHLDNFLCITVSLC